MNADHFYRRREVLRYLKERALNSIGTME